jgi:ParB family transcriptional regulator, chromosome partitioning protein
MSKPALGRGLGALLGGGASAPKSAAPKPPENPSAPATGLRRISVTQIQPSPFQPRRDFPETALRELAESIRAQGIIQPLVVRPVGDRFELIAGERRWRAAQLAGLSEAPVIVRTATDHEVVELALIENLQRENLNPVEEALGYSRLKSEFNLTQDDIAQKVGRSRAAVANALRLLGLPEGAQAALRDGRLSTGHAKAVLSLTDAARQQSLSDKIVAEGLSVRAAEALAASWAKAPAATAATGANSTTHPIADPHVADLENRLRERLATKVALRYRSGRGALEIKFSSDDELERVLEILGVSVD